MKKRMRIEKIEALFQIAIMIVATFAFAFLLSDIAPSVEAATNVCCEKTNAGAYCQNTLEQNCASGFLKSPTSCDSTSYCKEGCCYDSDEGICMESTSKKVCDESKGTWADSKECDIPQCQLGCCLLGGQASLVSLTRCKKLSLLYGLETDYRQNVNTEAECIDLSRGSEQGACVFESEFQKNCKFGSRQECKTQSGNATFYKDDLCSKEELGTICGKQAKTSCFDGKVYWVDSCGNKENIYYSDKDLTYNNGRILSQEQFESLTGCSTADAKNNPNCGNCDYLSGSICREYRRQDPASANPKDGDYFCRDLNCYDTYNGNDYKHGESWCVYDNQFDSVGSRQWRHVCIEGEEIVEPCADLRQEICFETEINTDAGKFIESACRANRWQQCTGLTDNECSSDQYDCVWTDLVEGGLCVPEFAPGLKFWDSSEASSICGSVSNKCTVIIEEDLFGNEKCIENCECLETSWAEQMNDICTQKGDCGGKVNILGKWNDGYKYTIDGESKSLGGSYKSEKSQEDKGSIEVTAGTASGNAYPIIAVPILVAGGISALYIASAAGGGFKVLGNIIMGTGTSAFPITGAIASSAAWALVIGTVVGQVASFFGTDAGFSDAIGAAVTAGIFSGGVAGGLTVTTIEAGTVISAPTTISSGTLLIAGTGEVTATAAAPIVITQAAEGGLILTGGTLTAPLTIPAEAVATGGITAGPGITAPLISTGWAIGIGIGIAIIVFVLTYKETKTIEVEFTCQTWQAPSGGSDCEKCNKDIMKPCSEYRCKSLGQSCSLLNAGTNNELCVNINPRDTNSPQITPWQEVLTKGYSYSNVKTRPPSPGMTILKDSGKCMPAFTPVTFGITTDEPAQCKIDYNRTKDYESMKYYFGETNQFLYNHTQTLSLPGPSAVNAQSPELKDNGEYTLYVRCTDGSDANKKGNFNQDEFAIRFCVDPEPDTTPPVIEKTSINNNAYVGYEQSTASLGVYLNEPSQCKWSKEDKDYKNMENNMACATSLKSVNPDLTYTCLAALTGLENRKDNKFYFRCEDQQWLNQSDRNVNKQSYKFTLKGSQPLDITSISPNETIKGSVEPVPVYLEVETENGAENGKSICYYSTTGNENNYIPFFDTNAKTHKQRQDLSSGNYNYYIKCVDSGGNTEYEEINFNVEVDSGAPRVTRVFNSGGQLEIITNEDSSCVYSATTCNYDFADGINIPIANTTIHETSWTTDKTYYIKCVDEYGNMPYPSSCSIIVRPYDLD